LEEEVLVLPLADLALVEMMISCNPSEAEEWGVPQLVQEEETQQVWEDFHFHHLEEWEAEWVVFQQISLLSNHLPEAKVDKEEEGELNNSTLVTLVKDDCESTKIIIEFII
jgi:hypothetical protein